jgi:spermidine/putrescine transport system permease protein
MSRQSRILWTCFAVVTVIFLLSPLALVVLFSFGQNEHSAFPMGGLTLSWYEKLFANSDFWVALRNSALVGLAVAVASVIIGVLGALALTKVRDRISAPILALLTLPLMLPPLVLGLALLSGYSALDWGLSLATVIPAQVVFVQPFVLLVIYARMASFDEAVIDSARDLGASPVHIFFTVTLPIIAPTVIGAGLIAVALSLDEFIITYYTIGGGLTLPTMVWAMLRTSLDPDINALATLILLFTLGSTALALRILRYRG